jgi:antitoxin (DNA-binding transcriptional repressor) of toxin-antitoxin stability system
MARNISLVAARKELGRIVQEIGRTGNGVNLTRRGKIVARIVPEERGNRVDALTALRGSAELTGSFAELTRELRTLRKEGGLALEQRTAGHSRRRAKRRA